MTLGWATPGKEEEKEDVQVHPEGEKTSGRVSEEYSILQGST